MAGVQARTRENSAGVVERWETPREISTALIEKWKKSDIFSMIAPILEFVHQYPITTLFIAVLLGLSSLPIIIFCSFITVSFLLTFLGFLMVEGTLISLAVVLLSVALFVVVCLSVFLSCFLVIMWCSTAAGYGIVHHAASLLDQYLPGLKLRLAQFFTIESPKRE